MTEQAKKNTKFKRNEGLKKISFIVFIFAA